MASNNGDILNAIQARLQTITIANGYPLNVTTVEINKGRILYSVPNVKLPYIDIINQKETIISHNVGGNIKGKLDITLRLVREKTATDNDMCDFQACILRSLFGNSYSVPQSNAMRLPYNNKELLTYMEYNNSDTDYNLIDANRMWDLYISCYYIRNMSQF